MNSRFDSCDFSQALIKESRVDFASFKNCEVGLQNIEFRKDATARAMRSTPVLFGRGLLDGVPDSVILSYADPDDRNRDGTFSGSGRAAGR